MINVNELSQIQVEWMCLSEHRRLKLSCQKEPVCNSLVWALSSPPPVTDSAVYCIEDTIDLIMTKQL